MFLYLTPQEFFAGLLTICVVNLVLSGDNAVVIAMASRNLPSKQRKQAIVWGSVFAIALRVVLTIAAVIILQIPYLRTIGAALLVFIGVKLLADEGSEGEGMNASGNMLAAIRTIVIADLIMSLDNVLAVAAASKGNIGLLVIGLAISVPIIIAGSQLLVWVMKKLPVIVYIGAGLIAFTAGEMVNGDRKIAPLLYDFTGHEEKLAEMYEVSAAQLHGLDIPASILNIPFSLNLALPVILIIVVCGLGWWIKYRRKAKAEAEAKAKAEANTGA